MDVGTAQTMALYGLAGGVVLGLAARVGRFCTMGALEGGLADTDYDPVTSPRKIVDRCMKNRGYELLSDLGKGMYGGVDALTNN